MVATAGDVFIDTNVLVYASRPSAPEHPAARAALAAIEVSGTSAWISSQILREYLAVVTRPQASAPSLPMEAAIADVRCFQSVFRMAEGGHLVLERLLALLGAYPGAGKQVHDANIVGTMLVYDIGSLMTFNTADFQRFAPVIRVEALVKS
jgi:predicted nucleic acid-binding protein